MRIYLAYISVFDRVSSKVKEKQIPYSLISFEVIRRKPSLFKTIQRVTEFKQELLLDSGAFTFMANNVKGKSDKIDWDSYIEEYADFINKNNINYFFELDIDVLVGLKEVERLRAKLENLTGKKSIPVWHAHRGIDYWKKMVDEYEYIAIGGLVPQAKDVRYKVTHDTIKKLVEYAHKKGVKVHGLGFTNLKQMFRIPFYSVDSTSWAGVRFGYVRFVYKGKHLLGRKVIKNFNPQYIPEIVYNNLEAWISLAKYADKKNYPYF